MTYVDPSLTPAVEAIIQRYFDTFNAGEFEETAALFAPEGVLYAPFETGVVGQRAIADYLKAEARKFRALPQHSAAQPDDRGEACITVIGEVQTPLFRVNVRWQFTLNAQSQILVVRVRLLAALKELLSLKQDSRPEEQKD